MPNDDNNNSNKRNKMKTRRKLSVNFKYWSWKYGGKSHNRQFEFVTNLVIFNASSAKCVRVLHIDAISFWKNDRMANVGFLFANQSFSYYFGLMAFVFSTFQRKVNWSAMTFRQWIAHNKVDAHVMNLISIRIICHFFLHFFTWA